MMKFVFIVLCLVIKGEGKSFTETRIKRATCEPEFEKISATHSACIPTSSMATPDPFTPEEADSILQQHIVFRAEEKATAMMRPVWDDDIAYVAQKWADACDARSHDATLDRLTASLMGIYIGQNVARYTAGGYPISIATDLWHGEIEFFTYGIGEDPSGSVIGHYTQVVLDDVSKIGCGRSHCFDGSANMTRIVCNYGRGILSNEQTMPFEKCEVESCKLNCLKRDEHQLCDCDGLMCLHQGTLDKTTCTCRCKQYFSGPSCETVDCANIGDDAAGCAKKDCWYKSSVCPSLCGVCSTPCDTTCDNGGTINTFTCKCTCPEGYSGDTCSIQDPTCSLTCENGGTLNQDACSCTCPSGFTGDNCNLPDPTCSLTCENGGTLNPDTCNCTCPSGFTGDNCILPDNLLCNLLRRYDRCDIPVWGPYCCPESA